MGAGWWFACATTAPGPATDATTIPALPISIVTAPPPPPAAAASAADAVSCRCTSA